MDMQALWLSLELAAATVLVLIPLAIGLGRLLAYRDFAGKVWLEAALNLPLVLPPTVIGYYLLVGLSGQSPLGAWYERTFESGLVFHFSGLLIASVLVNIPFAVQPIQRAFEAIDPECRDAADCCGLGFFQKLWLVELPLAWPGMLMAVVLVFAHTLGEFGVILMVGGSIPGETKTLSIAIYDQVQAFEFEAAGHMALMLLLISLLCLGLLGQLGRWSRLGRLLPGGGRG
jgi:molybdate transport system permease protein